MSIISASPSTPSSFPQLQSRINIKGQAAHDNVTKWEKVMADFETASREASLESRAEVGMAKYTSRQLLGTAWSFSRRLLADRLKPVIELPFCVTQELRF
jgi:hypothetical protein